jgi:hypothetical protein
MIDHQQKRMLIGGIGMVLFGCFIGLIPPPAVQHFRSIVTAHIEFTANGMLLSILGLIMPYLNLGRGTKFFLELTAYWGTASNGGAFLISAFTGYGTELAPTVHKQFPFPNGIKGFYSSMVTACLLSCGVTIIIALFLTVAGLIFYNPDGNKQEKKQ